MLKKKKVSNLSLKSLMGSGQRSKPQNQTHHVVVVVGTPEVRTVASTEVGFVTFGLMDPFPVEVPPEVDVERAQAAALVRAPEIQHTHTQGDISVPALRFATDRGRTTTGGH